MARIPGQSDYEHFPESARMRFAILLARGLARWSNRDFKAVVRRVHGVETLSASVTPLGAFLKRAPWVPVARVGDRQNVDYVAPSDAWYYSTQSADPPAFSPYVYHSVRAALQDNDEALRRFREVGGHDWLAPEDAPALVCHLTRICRDVGLQKIHHADFRAAYEHAWRECLGSELRSPFTDAEESIQVIAQKGDQFVVVPDSTSDSTLYIDAGVDSIRTAVINLLDWPILHVGPQRYEEPTTTKEREILLTRLLAEKLKIAVRPLSDVSVEILADGEILKPTSETGRKLVEENCEGLADLVTVYFALEWSGSTRSRRLLELENRLHRIRLVVSRHISVRIDGHEVGLPPALGGVLSLNDHDAPLLVVQNSDESSDIELLPKLAYQLAPLLGAKSHADGLTRVLSSVSATTLQHGLSMLSETQLSALFRVSVSRIAEIAHAFRGRHRHLAFLMKPALAYWIRDSKTVDQLALLFCEGAAADLHTALQGVEAGLPLSTEELENVCRCVDSPWELRDELGLDFATFNAVLAELGPPYEPQRNVEEHQLAFAEYVAQNRTQIEDALRLASLADFDAGNPPLAYARQRTLKGLEPDRDWLMVCPRPDNAMMQRRIDEWLTNQGVRDVSDRRQASFLPVSEVLRDNRRTLSDMLKELPLIVSTWFEKASRPVQSPWNTPDPRDAVAVAIEESGVLDFRPLDIAGIIIWMSRLSLWPTDMPPSVDLNTLGLTKGDIDRFRRREGSAQEDRRRARVSLPLDGEDVSLEESGAAEIIRRLNETLDPSKPLLPRTTTVLQEQNEGRQKGSKTGVRMNRSGDMNQSMSEEQRNLVGFIGEWIVFRALQQTYRIDHKNWIPSNCARQFNHDGIDNYAGYDFFVDTPTGPLFFEVKATTGDEGFIRLGQTEMDFAQRHADRRESYRILLIPSDFVVGGKPV